jgi:hypothetical protein
MLDSKTIKYGGWTLILASLFYILTFIFRGVPYGIFGLIATCLMAPTIWGLYEYYKQNDDGYKVRLGTLALIVGSLFIVWLYGSVLVAGLIEKEFSASNSDLLTAFETLLTTISGVGIMFGNIIFLGTFLLALSTVQTGSDPKWLGWLGLVGSVITIPWFFFLLASPILQMIPALGFAIVLIWMIVMGIRLIRYKSPTM